MRLETSDREDRVRKRRALRLPVELLPPVQQGAASPLPEAVEETPQALAPEVEEVLEAPPAQPEAPKRQRRPDPAARKGREKAREAQAEAPLRKTRKPLPEVNGLGGFRAAIHLSPDQVGMLERAGAEIGGVSAIALLRKIAKDWEPPIVVIDPDTPPDHNKKPEADRQYRVDLRFNVDKDALAAYRARYDKIELYSDHLLLRGFTLPIFAALLEQTVARLRG